MLKCSHVNELLSGGGIVPIMLIFGSVTMLLVKSFVSILLFGSVRMWLANTFVSILLFGSVRMWIANTFVSILLFGSVRLWLANTFVSILLCGSVRMWLANTFVSILLFGSVRMVLAESFLQLSNFITEKSRMRLEEVQLLMLTCPWKNLQSASGMTKMGNVSLLQTKMLTMLWPCGCANMGHHRHGQHLKFQDPPPALDEVMEQVMPDLYDALLTSKNVKEIEEEFNRHHSHCPTNLPACGACGRRHNMPDDSKLEHAKASLKDKHMDLHYASWEDSRYSKGERTMKVKVKSCC
jgi:hypothetical protein